VTSLSPAFLLQFGSSGNSFSFALPLILMFGIMYFLLFLPMQRQKKQQQKMLAELKSGDVVVTTGGIVGAITGLDKDTIVIRVKPDNLKLQVTRACVASVVPPPGEAAVQK
jgi:preprotein translocase subunit YajC